MSSPFTIAQFLIIISYYYLLIDIYIQHVVLYNLNQLRHEVEHYVCIIK